MKIVSKVKNDSDFMLFEYEITDEPIEDKEFSKEAIKLEHKIFKLIFNKPKEAIIMCNEAIKIYPHIPRFYTHRCVAFQVLNDYKNMNRYVCEIYQKFPNYLFAKCLYARLKMENKEYNKIPAIFNNVFCIKALYPSRNVFHVAEVATFDCTLGKYFCGIGEIGTAKAYLKELNYVASKHPATKELKHEIKRRKAYEFLKNIVPEKYLKEFNV